MNALLPVFCWSVLLTYGIAFGQYWRYFQDKSIKHAKGARAWLITALLLHTFYIVTLWVKTQHLPVGDTFSAITTYVWCSMLLYLALEFRLREMTMGVFLLPLILLLQLLSNLFIDFHKELSPVLTGLFFEFHVLMMISGYAAFTISFITSVMYLLLSREMQSKQLGIFFEKLPSLQFFDNLSNQAVNIGLFLVTIGYGMGFYLGSSVWQGNWTLDPKFIAVAVSWAIYIVHFVTRLSAGWQGKRAAIVSIIGFGWLLFSFIVVTTFFSKVHNFQ